MFRRIEKLVENNAKVYIAGAKLNKVALYKSATQLKLIKEQKLTQKNKIYSLLIIHCNNGS